MTQTNPPSQNDPHGGHEHGGVRPLSVLRAMIDAIDHDLLRLLARRYGLVSEIAEFKREHSLPIRDFAREREVIEDRRGRAMPLGLSPDLVESMFRLVLSVGDE
jgi:chorismate mutase-like protein